VRSLGLALLGTAILSLTARCTPGQDAKREVCPRPAVGNVVPEPVDLRSQNGVLKVELTYRSYRDDHNLIRYCYLDPDGNEAPTLRVDPGDWLILSLKNEASLENEGSSKNAKAASSGEPEKTSRTEHSAIAAPPGIDLVSLPIKPTSESVHSPNSNNGTHLPQSSQTAACAGGPMQVTSTNLHFHGLTVPSLCHQDDVLHTLIEAGSPAFEYRFRIPDDEPPGLYWYHPHVHGATKVQVLGGASGALIVEGIERAKPDLAGLPERVFVIRDQNLLNPNAAPVPDATAPVPPVTLDHDGDVMNTGTGTGKPAEDLSINFVPVPYPDYKPSVINIKPGERQLWRILNASAITYLSLQLLFNGQAQTVGIVGIDGIPLNEQGLLGNRVIWQNHLGIPPGGRIEFVLKGPPEGMPASLITRSVNTGATGENDPTRPLANIVSRHDALEPGSKLSESPTPFPPDSLPWLGKVMPVRTRKLYFSETPQGPADPNGPTAFFLTVDGQTPKAFDPNGDIPDIIVHQGDVEDWVIENRTQELHAFHIHQVHFLMLEWFGLPVNEALLRDTVNVPYWDGKNPVFPRVRLRIDFRDANAIGLFPYHCHLLEHEDAGMMGLVRVDPAEPSH
jgi:FtsP/CotA-like multicopper oxidase with cupredoxin domain